MFAGPDAAVYRAMLNNLRPSRIIEAGSGFSTAVALDEAVANPHLAGLEITCIEPYPQRLLSLLRPDDKVNLLRYPVQDVPLKTSGKLDAGRHLVHRLLACRQGRVGCSVVDAARLTITRARRGRACAGRVLAVHYPEGWLAEWRVWNEAYFLHTFLVGNAEWEILLFSSWLWAVHPVTAGTDL